MTKFIEILLKDRQDMTRAWARRKKTTWPEVEQQDNERTPIKKIKTTHAQGLQKNG
jgi:hypothetical protein